MKKSQKKNIDQGIIMVSSLISGFIVKNAIKKIRSRTENRKMKKKKIHESPWPNAIKWTLATSLVSGFTGLLVKRYTSLGMKKIKA